MKSFKQFILENKNIIIPRRSKEEREKNYIIATNKKIKKYVEDGSEGNLDLSNTPIKRLPDNLTEVNGNLNLRNSKIEDLDNLKIVNRLYLENTPIKQLPGSLTEIINLYLYNSKIEDLNNLKIVNGNLELRNTPIKQLPDVLIKVNGYLDLSNTPIKRLPDNLSVMRYIYIRNTSLSKNDELLKEYKSKGLKFVY